MRKGLRRLELIPFEANTPRSLPLPRDKKIKRLDLLFSASAVVAGGAASGTVVEDAPLMLMPKIEIIGNGSVVLFRSDAQGMYWKKCFEYLTPAFIAPPTAGDEATYVIGNLLRIDFINNMGRYPEDCFLPAYKFNSLNLVIDWGDPDNMFEGTYDRTCTISTAYGITPVIEETNLPNPKFVRIQDYIEKEVTATRSDFPIDITKGDHTYQNMMLKTLDADVRVNAVINLINLTRNDKFFDIRNMPFIQGQHMDKLDFSLEAVTNNVKAVDGCKYLILTEEGMITTGLKTYGLDTCKLLLDVTVGAGTTMIRVYTDRLAPYKSIIPN